MEFDEKKCSLNICSFLIFSSFLVSFINSLCSTNGNFLRFIFTLDGFGSGSSSTTSLLASTISAA